MYKLSLLTPKREREKERKKKEAMASHFNSSSLTLFLLLTLFSNASLFLRVESLQLHACDPRNPPTANFPFCKTSLPIQARVRDLIGRLTLQEKIGLLVNNAAPVPHLGIFRYEWWSEALHGVSNVGPGVRFTGPTPAATSFPQVITTAASFNATLWQEIGRVVSDEARAMYNLNTAGLTFWSPNVNIFRDPRWGRGQETPGEDPTVVSKYAAHYVKGLQEMAPGSNRLKVAACCKHYTAYDLDNWNGIDRFHFNAKVSKQDLEDTYNVPFKACVFEGRVASVMCSYNQVNGIPTCADPKLLTDTIRGQWRLSGYIVSDCDSVGVLHDTQHYTSTPEEAAAYTIKAGLDLDCGPFLAIHTESAIKKGLLTEGNVNWALTNTITTQMRLGMFDGPNQPYLNLGPKDVCTPAHQELALEAARQGIVLLKNAARSLPLSTSRHQTVAVIGPNSDATETMIGNYAGVPCKYTSPRQGIAGYAKTIIHQLGCRGVACARDEALFHSSEVAARRADATVLVMGLDQSIEREFKDRVGLLLPGDQEELINRVAAASKGPTILVLMSGGPVDVTFAQNNPRISAILWVGYPGQAGGAAIADVLFGKCNPGGKLPMTWYPDSYVHNLPMTEMGMRADLKSNYPGRTYRFYTGKVVYPFAYGMSYTAFSHSLAKAPTAFSVPLTSSFVASKNSTLSRTHVRVSHANCNNLFFHVHIDVSNTGDMDGAETVLMFAKSPMGANGGSFPSKQLVGFDKVNVIARSQKRVRMHVDVCKHLSVADEYGIRRIPMGEHTLHVGDLKHSVSLQTTLEQIKV